MQSKCRKAGRSKVHCHCGAPLVSDEEKSIEMCQSCLDQVGVPTLKSAIKPPLRSCIGRPGDLNTQALDHLLWMIDWWQMTAQQCDPQEVEYVAKRLEELAKKMRQSV